MVPAFNANIRFIDDLYVDYLKSQIESGDAVRVKKSLQDLCKLYRSGLNVHPRKLVALEQCIVGVLYTQGANEKVRRWALNAIAQLGREANCLEAVRHALMQYPEDPPTAASAIAAMFKITRKADDIMRQLNHDPTIVSLAALQHVEHKKLNLKGLPINIESATPDQLKLALLVVGLDRAPPGMLNPKHSNSKMVRVLGKHDDATVSQYSVWAITENPTLGLKDLSIDIKDVEAHPANVRSWLYHLLAVTQSEAQKRLDILQTGMSENDAEPRLGLARGLRNTYFDGLEPLVLHYEAFSIEVYEKEPPNSDLRKRMEATASGTPLFARLKRASLDGQPDLFREVTSMTNVNIYGNVQGGAVSITGDATNKGNTSIQYSADTITAIQSTLSKAEKLLHTATPGLDEKLRKEALEKVTAAKGDPTPEKVNAAFTVLKRVGELSKSAIDAAAAFGPLATELGKLLGLG